MKKESLVILFILIISFVSTKPILESSNITGNDTNSNFVLKPLSEEKDNVSDIEYFRHNMYLPKPEQGTLLSETNKFFINKPSTNYSMNGEEVFWVQDIKKALNGLDDDNDGKTFEEGDWDEAMYEITAVVVNITEHLFIFIDKNIETTLNTHNAIDLAQEFEIQIVPVINELGTPSDIDSNDRTIVLIFDFRDGGDPPISGFFWPLHQYEKSTNSSDLFYYSEEKEIVHLNSNRLSSVENAAPTLTHEYFHLIHFNSDDEEELWLEEGLATFTELLAGYKDGFLDYLENGGNSGYFQKAYGTSLTYFKLAIESYGIAFLFVLYFYQRYGISLIKQIVKSKQHGISSVISQIDKYFPELPFETVYNDWMITNFVNDPTNDLYSYPNFSYKLSASEYNSEKIKIIPSKLSSNGIPSWGNQFFTLPSNSLQPYKITLLPEIEYENSKFQMTVISKFDNGSWSYLKSKLFNDHSGSITVDFDNISDTKYLIISSLSGESSGLNTANTIPTNTYHLFVDLLPIDYSITNINSAIDQPSFYFQIFSHEGDQLSEAVVNKVEIEMYKWSTQDVYSEDGFTSIYNNETSSWELVRVSNSLKDGQYYLIIILDLANGEELKMVTPTFLLGDLSLVSTITTYSTSISDSNTDLGFITTFVLFFSIASLIAIKKRKKRDSD